VVAAINAADRSFTVVIQFLHRIRKANGVGSYLKMERRSANRSNVSSLRLQSRARSHVVCDQECGAVSEVEFSGYPLAPERDSRPSSSTTALKKRAQDAPNDCGILKIY
jgi:hypothetical protein